MSKNTICIGVDVGNSDTKSSLTSVPTGFMAYSTLPFGASPEEYIKYKDQFYVLTKNRFSYNRDKTNDEKMAILTLFSIAKEIVAVMESRYEKEERKEDKIRTAVESIDTVYLGVGLPPSHLSTLGEKTIQYYRDFFGDKVSYQYNSYNFNFEIGSLKVYPQNYAVIAANKQKEGSLMNSHEDFYALDFGGYTFDKVTIMDNRPVVDECDSLEEGVSTLCEQVIAKVRSEYGTTLTNNFVIKILKGEKTIVDEPIRKSVREFAESWTHGVLDRVAQSGAHYDLYPVIFMGGTSILLAEFIESYGKIKKYEIIRDTHANAKAYQALIRRELYKK